MEIEIPFGSPEPPNEPQPNPKKPSGPGKGSKPRPMNLKKYREEFDRIFRKPKGDTNA